MGNWVHLNTTPYVVVSSSIHEVVVVAVGLKLTDLVDLIWFIVFNATFSNISAISWRPGLVVQEAIIPRENYRYLVLLVVFVDQHLSFCPISFGHYIVCYFFIDLRLLVTSLVSSDVSRVELFTILYISYAASVNVDNNFRNMGNNNISFVSNKTFENLPQLTSL